MKGESADACIKPIMTRALEVLVNGGNASRHDVGLEVDSLLSQIGDLPTSHGKHETLLKLAKELGKLKEAEFPSPKKGKCRGRK